MHLPICHCLPLYHVPCESIITLVMSLCLSYGRQFFYLIQFYKKVQQSVLSLYRLFAFLLHHKTLVAKKLKAVAFSALLLWWWYYTTTKKHLNKQLVECWILPPFIWTNTFVFSKSVTIVLLIDSLFVIITLLQDGQVNIYLLQELGYTGLHLSKSFKIKLIKSY